MENTAADQLVEETMHKARAASHHFGKLDQEHTDSIVRAAYAAGFGQRKKLAEMAYEETGIGNIHDKTIKNIIATRFVYRDIRDQKTAGIISEDRKTGIVEIARPMGPIFAVTPITNPTSTALFKILISLKTRNPLVIFPHGAARKSTIEAARVCYEAALAEGAPENCIQWVPRASREQVLGFMSHHHTALVMATGSVSLVKAAYSSGTPAIGVGPGNVPVYIGKSADVNFAVDQILMSKLFDNGTICASEQAVIASKFNADEVIRVFRKKGAYLLDAEETEKVGKVCINTHTLTMNAEIIGKPAVFIANLAGINVPAKTNLLIAPMNCDQVGIKWPLSLEVLAPVLAFYRVENFEDGIKMCKKINEHGGLGHTVSIFSNDHEKIRYFAQTLNAGRIVVNTPSSQGALGGLYNSLVPSMVLACGSGGKNFTTDNITTRHLINIQRIAYRKVNFCAEHQLAEAFCCDDKLSVDEIERLCSENRPHVN